MISKVLGNIRAEQVSDIDESKLWGERGYEWWVDVEVELAHRLDSLGMLNVSRKKGRRVFGRCTSTIDQRIRGRADGHVVPVLLSDRIDTFLDAAGNLLTESERERFDYAVPISITNGFIVLGFSNDQPFSYEAFTHDLRRLSNRLHILDLDIRKIHPEKRTIHLLTPAKTNYTFKQLRCANEKAYALGMSRYELGFLVMSGLLHWLPSTSTQDIRIENLVDECAKRLQKVHTESFPDKEALKVFGETSYQQLYSRIYNVLHKLLLTAKDVHTLSSEASIEVLLQSLSKKGWDIIIREVLNALAARDGET